MAYKVVFVGAQAHEQTPQIAVYSLDSPGRITGKIATVTNGQLDLSRAQSSVIALGPDVANPSKLKSEGLITLRLADQLPLWNQTGEIQIPSLWWRGWLGFTVCLSGTAQRCNPFLDLAGLRSIALGLQTITFPERCEPLCNAVVEVWEYTTCCWPFIIVDVPLLIDNLAAFLAANPIMFPVPPPPVPGPLDVNRVKNVDVALGAGKVSNTFVPSTTLAVHLATLRSLSAQDAVTYIEAHPILWPFWCTGSSAMLGETAVNPDGSFSFCYHFFPFFRFNCRTSYFYKVKQLVSGVWTYVYDGSAANQYFSADEIANLYTQTGLTCFQPPALGKDYVALQAIGSTNTWELNSHWNGSSGSPNFIDLTQVGDTNMATPLDTDAGLELGGGAPWATTLALLLNYDAALQTASPSPYYYRLSIVQSDSNGNPLSGASPVPLLTPIAWSYFDTSTTPISIGSQSLGPVTVNGNQGLYQIPYYGGSNPNWLGLQFHQYLDTTALANNLPGGPGVGNGRFLLVLEVFDASGNRLVPENAKSPLATDTKGTFTYLRLLDSTTTAYVPYNSLTHILWVDNRPVVAAIEYFMNSSGVQTCQYYQGDTTTPFYVGFQAYHAVMCDAAPSPRPSNSFMSDFDLWWQEGLGGTSGTLASGDDTNWSQSGTCTVSVGSAVSTASLAGSTPPPFNVPIVTFGQMLGSETTCSFAITLQVNPKHTNGSSTIWAYEASAVAALALSDAPPPPPCVPLLQETK